MKYILAVILSFSLISCATQELNDPQAAKITTQIVTELTQIDFQSDEHTVEGNAVIGVNEQGDIQIDFAEDFVIDGGPDIFIYLVEKEYRHIGNGRPSKNHQKFDQQIAVYGESVAGKMSYVLKGVSIEQLKSFDSINFYCEAYGFIHWGGAELNWLK